MRRRRAGPERAAVPAPSDLRPRGACRALLVTTGRLTGPARRWVAGKPIEVWDGLHLARLSLAAVPAVPQLERGSDESPRRGPKPAACPGCGTALVRRHNRRTGEPFLGCPRFPACRHTQPVTA